MLGANVASSRSFIAPTEAPVLWRVGAADLRRIRNSRGLKPSQCARLEGHHDIARLLHAAPPPPGEASGTWLENQVQVCYVCATCLFCL